MHPGGLSPNGHALQVRSLILMRWGDGGDDPITTFACEVTRQNAQWRQFWFNGGPLLAEPRRRSVGWPTLRSNLREPQILLYSETPSVFGAARFSLCFFAQCPIPVQFVGPSFGTVFDHFLVTLQNHFKLATTLVKPLSSHFPTHLKKQQKGPQIGESHIPTLRIS